MPDHRLHRGPHPEDAQLFAPEALPTLRAAGDDLTWLLTRGYAPASSLKLVGDRYQLAARQRIAVARSTASERDISARKARMTPCDAVSGRTLWVDGYNVLTTIEAALAGGVILAARDGAYRDMASMHGSYRKVAETVPALEWIGRTLAEFGLAACHWYLDRPVSNSGRLKQVLEIVAARHRWPWSVELVADPDALLVAGELLVASADSAVLDGCHAWLNLARETVARRVPEAKVVAI